MPNYFSTDIGNARKLLNKSGFRGLRAAVYEQREVEAMLHPTRGLLTFLPDVQLMVEPSAEVVERLLKVGGFHYSPIWITWEQPVAPFAEHLARRYAKLGKEDSQAKKRLYNYSHSIEKSKRLGIEASFAPLSSSTWLEFYEGLFLPWVIEAKDAGVDGAGRDFPATHAARGGDISRLTLLLLRDSRDGNMLVGGAVLEDFEIKGTLKIKFAASDKSEKYRSLSLSYRAYDEAVGFAISRGFSRLSYGTEPNFYAPEGQADMITFGLNSFKAKLCFEPLLLDLPGYNKKRLFRLVSDKWTRQTSCFFYRFKGALSRDLEAAISGDMGSQVSFPTSTEQVDVTAEVRGTNLAEMPLPSSNLLSPISRFFKPRGG